MSLMAQRGRCPRCGSDPQVDQLSVTLYPGDRVLLEMGKYSAALAPKP